MTSIKPHLRYIGGFWTCSIGGVRTGSGKTPHLAYYFAVLSHRMMS
jgi:hypothetical protein